MPVEVAVHHADESTPVKTLREAARFVLDREGVTDGTLAVVMADENRMHELNKTYRNEDKPTNVLSFQVESRAEREAKDGDIGEIVLCPAVIEEQVKGSNASVEYGMVYCLIHGVLHLLGHEHKDDDEAERMEDKERRLIKSLYS